MTKKNMIQEIQNQEAKAYLHYQKAKLEFGRDTSITNNYRSHWCAIYELMEILDIASDHYHPDNQLALEYKARLRAEEVA